MTESILQSREASAAQVEIVRHAAELFGHYGYAKTNIGDIAERTGMSPANLYRHFRNKQAIGEEVVRCYMAAAEAGMGAVLLDPSADHEQKLRRVFRAGIGGLLAKLHESPRMVELAEMICSSQSGILAAHIEWKVAVFERLIREGVACGDLAVDDPRAAAETLLDATRAFWMPMALAQLDPERVMGRVERVLDMLLAGMRARGTT